MLIRQRVQWHGLSGTLCVLPCDQKISLETETPSSLDPATITSFLILDEVDDNVMLFRAVHIYAVYGVVNHVRAGQLPKGSFDLDMLLWEKWRTALAKQRSLVHLLNESWLRR